MHNIPVLKRAAGLLGAVGIMLGGGSALAGTATFDFTEDPFTEGLETYGNNIQPWHVEGGNPGGFLAITHAINDENFWATFPDIDEGKIVMAFRFEADLRVGNPSSGDRPADGFSISFARDSDPLFADPFNVLNFAGTQPESGTTTGIAVSFDTWAGNALPDGEDIEGIIVRVDNETVLREAMPTRNGACEDDTSLQTGPRDPEYWEAWPPGSGGAYLPESWETLCWQPLVVELDEAGRLSVTWKGRVLLDQYQTDYFPTAGRLVLAGRTGGANEHTHIDNIQLTTTAVSETEPPTAPSNFHAEFTGAARVELAWDPATDDSGRVTYEILRNGEVVSPALLTETQFVDTGVLPNQTYTYTIHALDVAQNTSDVVELEVTTPGEAPSEGWVKGEIWYELPGTVIEDIIFPIEPRDPDRVVYLNGLSYGETTAFGNTFGDSYGLRVTGTLMVPETGEYHFFLRSDDSSALFLNPEGSSLPDTATVFPIAKVVACCQPFHEPDAAVLNPDGTAPTTKSPISLTAGQEYGFIWFVKEGGGGDWGQVAMRMVGDPTPAAQLQPIRGPLVHGTADDTGASLTITEQPQSQTVAENSPVTISVAAEHTSPYGAPIVYQWYRNGEFLLGATGNSISVPFVTPEDDGDTYQVWVGTQGAHELSSEATLTIGEDVTAPAITSVSGSDATVVIGFNEPIDQATAETAANYQLDGGATVASANLVSGEDLPGLVVLEISGASPLETYTVTVGGVEDRGGNAVNASGTFVASHLMAPFEGSIPAEIALVGAATNQPAGGVNGSGYLQLTPGAGSLSGNANIGDLLAGGEASQFTLRFNLFIGNGSGNPADGFSVSVASELTADTSLGEEGSTNGLAVAFDTYDNAGGEAPAIDIKWEGVEVAHTVVPKEVLVNNEWVEVVIQVNADGQLTVIHDGVTYYDAIDIGYQPITAPRVNFGARTGGEFAEHGLDNVWLIYNQDADITEPTGPEIEITEEAGVITISYDGTLYSSETVTGPYAPVEGAANPYEVDPSADSMRFFQAVQE